MKEWAIWINSNPEWMKGSVVVSDQPLWLWCVGKAIERLMFPHWMSYIPLPDWPKALHFYYQGKRSEDFTPAEFYGDLSGLWHSWIGEPLFQWWWEKSRHYDVDVEIGYAKLKELFEAQYPDVFKHEAEIETKEVTPS